jgi:hypothetical protein
VQGVEPSRIKTCFNPFADTKGIDRFFEEAEKNLIPYGGTAEDLAEHCRSDKTATRINRSTKFVTTGLLASAKPS